MKVLCAIALFGCETYGAGFVVTDFAEAEPA